MSNTTKVRVSYDLYDGRYLTDPDSAQIYEACETLKEALQSKDDYGTDTVIVKTEMQNKGQNKWVVLSHTIIENPVHEHFINKTP